MNPSAPTFQWWLSINDARRRIHDLEVEKAGIVRGMDALLFRFASTLSPPWPVRPVIQRLSQGNVYVRWRLPGRNGQQPYVDLTSEDGRLLLQSLSVDVRRLLVQFAREVLCLNLAHSKCQSEWMRLRQFVSDNESLIVMMGR